MFDFIGKPCLIFKEKYLVLADVHLGYEIELLRKGINVPSQTEKIINEIIQIGKDFDLKKLIIVGDFKHNVPKVSYQELKEIPEAIKKLAENFDQVIIIKGNHDGKLEELVPKLDNVKITKEMRIGKVVFTHGHRKPRFEGKLYIIGHNHPVYYYLTSIGEIVYEKVFIYGYAERFQVLILPAFNPLIGGYEPGNFNGPIAKKIIDYDILNLEGIIIG